MRFLFNEFLQLLGNVTEFFEFILTSVFRTRSVDGARKPRHWFLRLTLLPRTIFRYGSRGTNQSLLGIAVSHWI